MTEQVKRGLRLGIFLMDNPKALPSHLRVEGVRRDFFFAQEFVEILLADSSNSSNYEWKNYAEVSIKMGSTMTTMYHVCKTEEAYNSYLSSWSEQ